MPRKLTLDAWVHLVPFDIGRAHFLTLSDPGVVVLGAIDNDSLPSEFVDFERDHDLGIEAVRAALGEIGCG
jgi:hypothetical protein